MGEIKNRLKSAFLRFPIFVIDARNTRFYNKWVKIYSRDNVIIERWFRSLKTEYVYINDYNSPRELRNGIKEYVQDYNTLRPHQSLGYNTPAVVYNSSFPTKEVA